MSKVPYVITFHSFKGGVGKSWLALNLARDLSLIGKKVLLIEADFSMPTYFHIFQDLNVDIYFNDYLTKGVDSLSNYIYKTTFPNFDIVSCSPNFKASDNLFSNNQGWFLDRIKLLEKDVNSLDYDCILFDMSPGFTLFLVNVLSITNHGLIISRSDINSIRGSEYLIERVYAKLGVKQDFKLHLIINQIPRMEKFKDIINDWMNRFSVKFPIISSFTPLYLDEEIIFQSAINQYYLPEDTESSNDLKTLLSKIISD